MNLYTIKLSDNELKDLRTLLIKQMGNESNYILFSEDEGEFAHYVDSYLRMSLICEKLRVLKLRGHREFKLNIYEYAIIQFMFESVYWDCTYKEKYFKVPIENVEHLANIFNNIKISDNCKKLDEDYVFNCTLSEKLYTMLDNCTMG